VTRAAIETVFEVVDYPWRGIGPIPASGMALKSLKYLEAIRDVFGRKPE
jgi:hydrogenase maturation factor